MKNPFVKDNDNSLVIAAVAIGALAAGAIAYLYATKKGFAFRKKLSNTAEEGHEKATEYLEKKARKLKKKTTDLHHLEGIVSHS
jgi:phage-related minor tail protein